VESSSTKAYWYTNSEGVIYFNIHIQNKIDSPAGSTTSGTWIFGPLLGTEGGERQWKEERGKEVG